jgi:pectinesterase
MGQYHISASDQHIVSKVYQGDLSARIMHEDGRPYHTFRTYTVLADGSHLSFENCTFENNAGIGKEVGQAIALYLDGDDIHVTGCTIRGHQDTLFLAPLPEKEREKDGFIGPKQFEPRTMHTYYFENCLIEGGVDFIFGGGEAYFDHCEFRSNEAGYVFAPNTPKGAKKGFTARNCSFTCTENVPDGSCYIARPWRDDAKVTIEDCELGRHIASVGWSGWNKAKAEPTTEFTEIRSKGIGANDAMRPDWVKVIR